MSNLNLKIGWLYPDLMSTYGDRGNVIVLEKRCQWRGIEVEIKRISISSKFEELRSIDLIFMGGAQDTQQEIVNRDLFSGKGEVIKQAVESGIPALFICGAYQFMGKYYITAESKKLEGLGLFNLYTKNPGLGYKRLIGNIIIQPNDKCQITNNNSNSKFKSPITNLQIVGFENHGGRTYLSNKDQAFATVVKGYGNNGEDGTEGIFYKNAIGSYLHGPLLPKNPELADWLIQKALEVKYKKEIKLKPLNDELEYRAMEKAMLIANG